MQIQFKSEGGIAYFPGLSRTHIIDTNTLSPDESKKIKELVDQCGFFNLHINSTPPTKGADRKKYIITIIDGSQRNTVQLYDPVTNESLSNLLQYLTLLTKRK